MTTNDEIGCSRSFLRTVRNVLENNCTVLRAQIEMFICNGKEQDRVDMVTIGIFNSVLKSNEDTLQEVSEKLDPPVAITKKDP